MGDPAETNEMRKILERLNEATGESTARRPTPKRKTKSLHEQFSFTDEMKIAHNMSSIDAAIARHNGRPMPMETLVHHSNPFSVSQNDDSSDSSVNQASEKSFAAELLNESSDEYDFSDEDLNDIDVEKHIASSNSIDRELLEKHAHHANEIVEHVDGIAIDRISIRPRRDRIGRVIWYEIHDNEMEETISRKIKLYETSVAIAKHYMNDDMKKVHALVKLDQLYVKSSRAYIDFKKKILNEQLITRDVHLNYKVKSGNIKMKMEEIINRIRSLI